MPLRDVSECHWRHNGGVCLPQTVTLSQGAGSTKWNYAEKATKEIDEQKSLETFIPDIYVNSARISISVFDVQLNLALRSDPEGEAKEVAVIRMSPQHALAMAKLLLKNLRVYEEQVGKIALTQELLERLEIEGDGSSETGAEL